jgi:hypothetical protein
MTDIFRSYRDSCGIVGIAYGTKITAGRAQADTPSVAFFVGSKIEQLKTSSHWNGIHALPGELTLEAGTIVTDVVEIGADAPPATGVRTNKPLLVPGDEITSDGKSGTMACLVRDQASGQVLALTNNHVAARGRQAKFRHDDQSQFAMPVTQAVLHLPDQDFMPFVDDPNDQLRVDASLIALRPDQVRRFSNVSPHFGSIGAPYQPDYSSLESYRRSLDQLEVYAYSFNTKRRFGRITHVYGILDDPVGGTLAKACLLIMGRDGIPPSDSRDSGKLWMTRVTGENRPVGLHFGRLEHAGSRLATATDFGALCRYWNLEVFH